MATKRLLTAIRPPKPIDQMTAAERAKFGRDVMTQIAAAKKKAQGK